MSEAITKALQAACNYIDTLGGVSTGYRATLSQPAPLAGEVTDEQIETWSFWEQFPGYLIDNHEGDILTEEMLQHAASGLQAKLKAEGRAILALRPQAAVSAVVSKTDRIEIAFRHCDDGTVDAFAKIDQQHKTHAAGNSALEAATTAIVKLLGPVSALRPQAVPMTLPPVEGDVLPPVGSKVLIHLASSGSWAEHEVVGYYVWEAINELAKPRHHRVFVRVRDSDGILNARHLCDVRGITAKAEGGAA